MTRDFDPEKRNILVHDAEHGPIMISYIYGADDTDPIASVLFWGNNKYRDASFYLSSAKHGAESIRRFYADVLGGYSLGLLDHDLVVDLMELHFVKNRPAEPVATA